MDLGLEIELDAQKQRRILELAILIDGTLDQLPGLFVEDRVGTRSGPGGTTSTLSLGLVVADGSGAAGRSLFQRLRGWDDETHEDIFDGEGLSFSGRMSGSVTIFSGLTMGDGARSSGSTFGAVGMDGDDGGGTRATLGVAGRTGERAGLEF